VTLTDGAIMFVCCSLSFVAGYIIGAVRVTRFVNKRLEVILQIMTTTREKPLVAVAPRATEPRSIEDEV
jgi:hypothetical protein